MSDTNHDNNSLIYAILKDEPEYNDNGDVIGTNKVIANIVVATPEHARLQTGWLECSAPSGQEPVQIGWRWIEGQGFIKPPPLPRNIAYEWSIVRQERDSRLLLSDLFVLPDRWAIMSAQTQQNWSIYRQQLRDIPVAFDDPKNVVWPTLPI